MDNLTWLGWVFLIDLVLSVPIWLVRAGTGGYTKTAGECLFSAVFCILYAIGFLTIGFTHA